MSCPWIEGNEEQGHRARSYSGAICYSANSFAQSCFPPSRTQSSGTLRPRLLHSQGSEHGTITILVAIHLPLRLQKAISHLPTEALILSKDHEEYYQAVRGIQRGTSQKSLALLPPLSMKVSADRAKRGASSQMFPEYFWSWPKLCLPSAFQEHTQLIQLHSGCIHDQTVLVAEMLHKSRPSDAKSHGSHTAPK